MEVPKTVPEEAEPQAEVQELKSQSDSAEDEVIFLCVIDLLF